MKEFGFKNDFLKAASKYDTPIKVIEVTEERKLKATVWLRTALVSWEKQLIRDISYMLKDRYSTLFWTQIFRPLI